MKSHISGEGQPCKQRWRVSVLRAMADEHTHTHTHTHTHPLVVGTQIPQGSQVHTHTHTHARTHSHILEVVGTHIPCTHKYTHTHTPIPAILITATLPPLWLHADACLASVFYTSPSLLYTFCLAHLFGFRCFLYCRHLHFLRQAGFSLL